MTLQWRCLQCSRLLHPGGVVAGGESNYQTKEHGKLPLCHTSHFSLSVCGYAVMRSGSTIRDQVLVNEIPANLRTGPYLTDFPTNRALGPFFELS